MDQFLAQIFAVIHQIPCGKVTTYGEIAKLAGYPAMLAMSERHWVTCRKTQSSLGLGSSIVREEFR